MQVANWKFLKVGGLAAMLYAVPVTKWAALLKLGSALDSHRAAFKQVGQTDCP